MDDSKEKDLILIVILIGVLTYIVWFFVGNSSPQTAVDTGPASAVASPTPVLRSDCGRVVKECEVGVNIQVESCDRAHAAAQAESALSDPFKLQGCAGIEKELAANCVSGCDFNFASRMVIPGVTKFDFSTTRDEAGVCHGKARKTVTVSGTCIRQIQSQNN